MVDVEAVRGLARQVAGAAAEVRGAAGRTRTAEGVDWESVAAGRWRHELREEARRVDEAAEALDDAVRALHAHADAVERRLAQIAAAQRAFDEAVDRARRTVADAADDASDAATAAARGLLAAASRVPSPGSLDWPSFTRGWL